MLGFFYRHLLYGMRLFSSDFHIMFLEDNKLLVVPPSMAPIKPLVRSDAVSGSEGQSLWNISHRYARCRHSVLFPPPSHKLHPLKVHMEITIRGVSCSILEAICPNCHLSISSHFIHLCHRDQRRSPYSPCCSGERAVSTSPAPALSIRLLLQDHDIINNFASPEDFFLSFSLPLCRRTSQRNVSQF